MTIAVTGATGHLGRRRHPPSDRRRRPPTPSSRSRARPAKAAALGRHGARRRLRPARDARRRRSPASTRCSSSPGTRSAQRLRPAPQRHRRGEGGGRRLDRLHQRAPRRHLAALAGRRSTAAPSRRLAASGIPHTILRNGWYVENYTASIPGALAGGALRRRGRRRPHLRRARADYAAAAAAVLTGDGHAGRTYELAADEAFTLADLAAEISRQTGRQIPYRDLSEADYAAALAGFGLPEAAARAYAGFDAAAAAGRALRRRPPAALVGADRASPTHPARRLGRGSAEGADGGRGRSVTPSGRPRRTTPPAGPGRRR